MPFSRFDLRMESQDYFLELGAGFAVPTNMGAVDCYDSYCGRSDELPRTDSNTRHSYGGVFAEVGASYYLSDGNIAPYLGGGLIPSVVSTTAVEDPGGMLAVYGQFGLMLARESSSRFYAELRVAQHLVPISTLDRNEVWPTELTLAAGVGF